MSAFFWIPYQLNTSLKKKMSSIHSLLQVLRKVNVLMHINVLHTTVQMGILVFKLLIFISLTFQCHMMTPSESKFLSWIWMDSLTLFWMSIMHSRIQIFSIHERLCVSPPPYYIDWFEKYYPTVHLNQDEVPFFIQFMNGINVTKPSGWQWNRILDAVITILKYNKITIDHAI